MSGRFCLSLTALAALVASSFAQGDPGVIQKILENGRDKSRAKAIHTELCEDVGPRLTGSRALERGTIWAIKQFTEFGLSNIQLDEWGKIPVGFDRGKRQRVRMTAPYNRDMIFSTPCWTVGTKSAVEGPVVRMPETAEDLEKVKKQLKGAWVLMPKPAGMRGPDHRKPTELDQQVDKLGIAGRVYRTDGDLVWTGGVWTDYTDETRPKTPLVVITKRDYESLTYSLDKGRVVKFEADIENIFTRREFPVSNIIAEIPGTENPDEFVIVGGHFDSWNGPGSQGASDNGTGTTAALEAARILVASGAKPKRTIRFILWTGEEQGLFGSTHYANKHKDSLDKIVAVLNEDSGQNYQAAIAGLPSMMPLLREAAAPLINAFPDMPFEVREVQRMSRSGSDHVPFIQRGVPAFFMVKGGDLSYRHVWHTQNDKHTEVPEQNLKQMATNMAVLAYNLACAEDTLPRVLASQTTMDWDAIGGAFDEHEHADSEMSMHCKCGAVQELIFKLARKGFR